MEAGANAMEAQSNASILVYISGRSCFSGITTYNIPTFLTLVLIKGGLIEGGLIC